MNLSHPKEYALNGDLVVKAVEPKQAFLVNPGGEKPTAVKLVPAKAASPAACTAAASKAPGIPSPPQGQDANAQLQELLKNMGPEKMLLMLQQGQSLDRLPFQSPPSQKAVFTPKSAASPVVPTDLGLGESSAPKAGGPLPSPVVKAEVQPAPAAALPKAPAAASKAPPAPSPKVSPAPAPKVSPAPAPKVSPAPPPGPAEAAASSAPSAMDTQSAGQISKADEEALSEAYDLSHKECYICNYSASQAKRYN